MEMMLTDRLATLGHPQRMAVFRLLMRRCPDALPAGEIVAALGLKASTASVYLAALMQAGLITQRREGTRLLYAVDLGAVRAMVSDLFVGCCRGRADLCPPPLADLLGGSGFGTPTRVLFVCTGNSARSVMAEAILRDLGQGRFRAASGGTAPRPEVQTAATDMLMLHNHDVAGLRPGGLAAFRDRGAEPMDIVITLCDRAANEDCGPMPGAPVMGHWGMPAPSETGDFTTCYAILRARIGALVGLAPDQLDRATLQQEVDRIGRMKPIQD